jgi:hypothetical protein
MADNVVICRTRDMNVMMVDFAAEVKCVHMARIKLCYYTSLFQFILELAGKRVALA